MTDITRAGRNRTIELSEQEKQYYLARLLSIDTLTAVKTLKNTTVNQDTFTALPLLIHRIISLNLLMEEFSSNEI